MYYSIYDHYRVENLKPNGNKPILIRILNPNTDNDPFSSFKYIGVYKDVLELYFDDIQHNKIYEKSEYYFSLKDMKKLNDFILKNDFDEVVVHCTLGLSRSLAIMICIAKILNSNTLEQLVVSKFKIYNKSLVNIFEKYPYQIKECNNQNFIFDGENIYDYMNSEVGKKC